MKKKRKDALKIAFVLVSLLLPLKVLGASVPYTPPHPYPNPDDPNFPAPGNFMYETVGFTVDELSDTTKYFRSDTFRQSLESVEQRVSTSTCKNAVSQYFTQIQSELKTNIQERAKKLTDKKNQIVNEAALNDGMTSGANASTPYDKTNAVDEALKQQVVSFYDSQYQVLFSNADSYYNRAVGATTCSQLKTLSQDIQAYVDNPVFQSNLKTLGARIMSERVNHFSAYVQTLVDFVLCIGPQLDTLYHTTDYEKYWYSPNSRFYTDWYQLTPLTDAKRSWATFSYKPMDTIPSDNSMNVTYTASGAREEYRKAANVLKSEVCVGAPSAACKDPVHMHMRAGKYVLQDMFHIAYWGYDNMLVMQENGIRPDGQLDFNACPMPEQNFMVNSSSPTGAWPTTWPTPRSGIRR